MNQIIADDIDRLYVEGLRRNELIGGRCRACHKMHFYPRRACKHCGSLEVESVALPAHGSVYTFAKVADTDKYIAGYHCPYLVIVELECNVRLVSRLVVDDGAADGIYTIQCGDRLSPLFVEDQEKGPLLIYRRATDGAP